MEEKTHIKRLLINLLNEDGDIRETIRNMVSDKHSHPLSTLDSTSKEPESQTVIADRSQQLDRLTRENTDLEDTIAQQKKVLAQQQAELSELKHALAEQQQKNTKGQEMFHKIKQLLGVSEKDNETFNAQIKKLNDNIQQLKATSASLQESLTNCETQVQRYETVFASEIAAYEKFQSLSEQTKASLKGIFKDDSMAGFIACGVQEKSIDSLWEYLKNEVMEDNNNDIAELQAIFDFLFTRFSLAAPLYERQQVAPHEEFDAKQHIKHSGSHNVSGDIQSILLSGWINNKTNKIIKQSIVSI